MLVQIVDDSPIMRETIKAFFADAPVDFCECADGSEALMMFAARAPDWVLMDIKMKGMDGLVATRAIKRSFPFARIVIVTNYDDDTLREEARQAGAVEYILKDDLSPLQELIR